MGNGSAYNVLFLRDMCEQTQSFIVGRLDREGPKERESVAIMQSALMNLTFLKLNVDTKSESSENKRREEEGSCDQAGNLLA